ncbi:hypothetical protein Tco_0189022 [Tanacetum coccineum]
MSSLAKRHHVQDNGENIMKSSKEGPFQMDRSQCVLLRIRGSVHQGHFVYARNKAMVQDGKVCSRCPGRYSATYQEDAFQRNNAREMAQARECPRPKRLQDSELLKYQDATNASQRVGAVLDEEQSFVLAGNSLMNVIEFDSDDDMRVPLYKPCSWQISSE